jgi:outer membrane protein OmpA-like peptidoglycan-associated protein
MVEDGIDPKEKLGDQWRGVVLLQYDHVDTPLIVIDSGRSSRQSDIVDDFQRLRVSVGHFLSERWFLGVSTSIDRVVGRPYSPDGSNTLIDTLDFDDPEILLGDSTLIAKYRFAGEDNTWNWTLIPYVVAPTGDEEHYNTDASFSGGLQVAFTKYIGSKRKLRAHGNLGYGYFPESRFNSDDTAFENEVSTKGRITGGAGLTWLFSSWGGVYAEFMGLAGLPFEKDQNPIEVTTGIKLDIGKRTSFFGGVGIEGVQSARSHDNRYIGAVKFAFNEEEKKPAVAPTPTAKRIVKKVVPISKPIVKVEKVDIAKKLSLFSRVNFESGKAVIKPESKQNLSAAADLINKHKDRIENITIEGHTDSAGDASFNKYLSQRRAEAVKGFLMARGVDATKLSAVGYGEEQLLVQEKTAEDRRKNRRVDFVVKEFGISSGEGN